MSSFNKATCYSHTSKDYCDFKWVISDYTLIFTKETQIKSPIFNVGSDLKKFQLQLNTGTMYVDRYSNATSRILYLQPIKTEEESNEKYNLAVKYHLSVIKDGEIVHTRMDYWNFSAGGRKTLLEIKVNEMKNYVSSTDSIIFHLELTVSSGNVIDSLNNEPIKMDQVLTSKLKFDWAFRDKKFCDVVLNASGKAMAANRLMLAAASPVFKAMFSHDMQEKKCLLIDLKDVNYEALDKMLRYIYTGIVEEHGISLTIDLLVLADKYQIDELKTECEKILSSKLSSKNVLDILKVADKCSMKSLKKNAVDFIKHHIGASSDSDDVGNMILSMELLNST
ncbi:speckle-type POZ protein A-like [Trichogramma pretiosum]|uniref:speckle-type POZ protein A-like n=1 Tax=Trichogramma pretiosum TaxID=7493 RepID=UPI000C71A85B|nr:speckle-type POZ protein A-like [Trichogramma pretiosum]